MIKLHGFAVSNYYNMVKYALMEKGLDFKEVEAMPSQEAEFKLKSPMGKVPCIETEKGFLSETMAMFAFVEATAPSPALLPADPWARGKVVELCRVIELYIELPCRRHYAEIFFGEGRSQAAFDEVKPVVENGLQALRQLGQYKPFLAGKDFTYADIMAAYTFCYAAPVCQAIYGMDIVGAVPGLQGAIDATNARDVGKKVAEVHQAALKAFQEAAA